MITASKDDVQRLKSQNAELRGELAATTAQLADALDDVEVETLIAVSLKTGADCLERQVENVECMALLEEVMLEAEEYNQLYDQYQRQYAELDGIDITEDPMVSSFTSQSTFPYTAL